MATLHKTLMHALLTSALLFMVAAPGFARIDSFRCLMTQSTHFGVCCAKVAVNKRSEVRRVPPSCCAQLWDGSAPLSAEVAPQVFVAVAQLAPTFASSEDAASPALAPRFVVTRSRAPPDPLRLTTSRFLI